MSLCQLKREIWSGFTAEALRSGDTGCSAEEYKYRDNKR